MNTPISPDQTPTAPITHDQDPSRYSLALKRLGCAVVGSFLMLGGGIEAREAWYVWQDSNINSRTAASLDRHGYPEKAQAERELAKERRLSALDKGILSVILLGWGGERFSERNRYKKRANTHVPGQQ